MRIEMIFSLKVFFDLRIHRGAEHCVIVPPCSRSPRRDTAPPPPPHSSHPPLPQDDEGDDDESSLVFSVAKMITLLLYQNGSK